MILKDGTRLPYIADMGILDYTDDTLRAAYQKRAFDRVIDPEQVASFFHDRTGNRAGGSTDRITPAPKSDKNKTSAKADFSSAFAEVFYARLCVKARTFLPPFPDKPFHPLRLRIQFPLLSQL